MTLLKRDNTVFYNLTLDDSIGLLRNVLTIGNRHMMVALNDETQFWGEFQI